MESDMLEDQDLLEDNDEFVVESKKRLRTSTVILYTLLLLAIGFYAGMRYQKSQTSNSTTPGASSQASRFGLGTLSSSSSRKSRAGGARLGAGRASGFAARFGGAVTGTVANISGNTLYITESSGNTVEVSTNGATFTQTTSGSVSNVLPGDTVLIRGSKQANGSYEATSVSINPAIGGGAGLGLFTTGGAGTGTGAGTGASVPSSTTGGASSNPFGPFG